MNPAHTPFTRRSLTISPKELRSEQRAHQPDDLELVAMRQMEALRPRTRTDCADGPRPCLFCSCRFHLYMDINPATGSIKFNFPDIEPWEMTETCALDIADRGGVTLEEVGALLNITRERVRQIEQHGLKALSVLADDIEG